MSLATDHRAAWTGLSVHLRAGAPALEGDARLAALVRWLRKEGAPGLVVRDPAGRDLQDPVMVNWDRFPLQRAIDAAHAFEHVLG